MLPNILKTKTLPHRNINLYWDLSPFEITKLCEEIIDNTNKQLERLLSKSVETVDFQNFIIPFLNLESWRQLYFSSCMFPQYVSKDSAIRKASYEATQKLNAFEISLGMREDLYNLVKSAHKNSENLKGEDLKIMEKMLLNFKRSGMELSLKEREKIKSKFTELSTLSSNFQKNVSEDKTFVAVKKEELDGLPEDFINSLEKLHKEGDSFLKVTMNYPHVYPILEHAKSKDLRRKVEFAFGSRCAENIVILEKAVILRKEIAQKLGYESHAHFVLEEKMAKTLNTTENFLENLRKKLSPIAKKEIDKLLNYKSKVEKNSDGVLNSFDISYYKKLYEKQYFSINEHKIKEYFPIESVTKSMLEIYEEILGLNFKKLINKECWEQDEDISLYEVSDSQSLEKIGYFYLDLFPREGKYSHAACFPIQMGSSLSDQRQLPVAAMVSNFTKPSASVPSLLRHNEVVTYFHELGHVMHHLCSKTKYPAFHGCNVEGDFVEAPSQMLENWCWNEKILEKLSSHYRTGESIPPKMIQPLIYAKNHCVGMNYLRQIFFAMFDLKIHKISNETQLNTTEMYNNLREKITFIPGQKGTFPQATFGHMMGGYDAGYYGYLWSQVYSTDMFYSKFKKNIMSSVSGLEYRNQILAPGGSINATDMLKSFLGREPNPEAFIADILKANDNIRPNL